MECALFRELALSFLSPALDNLCGRLTCSNKWLRLFLSLEKLSYLEQRVEHEQESENDSLSPRMFVRVTYMTENWPREIEHWKMGLDVYWEISTLPKVSQTSRIRSLRMQFSSHVSCLTLPGFLTAHRAAPTPPQAPWTHSEFFWRIPLTVLLV